MDQVWNPWHGCHKYSRGCQNCYVFRRDLSIGKDPQQVYKTASYDLPMQKNRAGTYRLAGGQNVYTCLSSDFFLEEADPWREGAWECMKMRPDLMFYIITKRITRAHLCLPEDWGRGYPNVLIGCTVEDQAQCDARMEAFLSVPCVKRFLVCEPLLEPIDFYDWLEEGFEFLICGGESGPKARECNYDWVLDLRRQCLSSYVPFHFKQTGANFVKNGKRYLVPRSLQKEQAKRANIAT